MAINNLTPDIGDGASDYILCVGRNYIFEEDDPNAVFIKWLSDSNLVSFSNDEGRSTRVTVTSTGRYMIYTELESLP